MKTSWLLFSLSILSLEPIEGALAQQASKEVSSKLTQSLLVTEIPHLHDRALPNTSAKELLETEYSSHQQPNLDSSALIARETETEEVEEEVVVEGKRQERRSTSEYVVTQEEIKKQGNRSVAEVLRGLPGFAINDVGFGADIHTGSYYRGSSINQSVFLLNGRPIGNNINTYHGTTDLNSIPVETIERIEVSSGTSSTLYGSEAFGGVVNIITKQSTNTPKFNGLVQLGSLGQENYRGSYRGTAGSLNYTLGYEQLSGR